MKSSDYLRAFKNRDLNREIDFAQAKWKEHDHHTFGDFAKWFENQSPPGCKLTGSSSEIFPGWKRIVSSWSIAVRPSGTSGIIYFNQEIPITSKILIEATIQSSPATTTTIKFPVPLTIAGINGTGQGVLFEICSIYLGINSTPGSIKLICSSVITGANGVQGMNVVVQSNNLSDASDIIQIKGIYFKA